MRIRLLFTAAILLLNSEAPLGCVCTFIPDIANSLKKAKIVFAGKVESISEKHAKVEVEPV